MKNEKDFESLINDIIDGKFKRDNYQNLTSQEISDLLTKFMSSTICRNDRVYQQTENIPIYTRYRDTAVSFHFDSFDHFNVTCNTCKIIKNQL